MTTHVLTNDLCNLPHHDGQVVLDVRGDTLSAAWPRRRSFRGRRPNWNHRPPSR